MFHAVLSTVLGLAALTFFTAERSLSLFSWSRLEELGLPRFQKHAAANCLRERPLAMTVFLVGGCVTLAPLAAVLAAGAHALWVAAIEGVLLALLLGWIWPEAAARLFGDFLAVHLVPPLYETMGGPVRAVRRLLLRRLTLPGGEGEQPAAPPAPGPAASDAEAHRLFRRGVRIRHLQVREIMTPRTDMVSVADTATLSQAARAGMESGYSRLPVYRSNRDQILGILHVKDLLHFAGGEQWDRPALASLVRQPFFVPETKAVSELLEELQRSNVHMGIVVDEYGGTCGLVTLEDVVEELIGEIRDEHESPQEEAPLFRWVDDRTVEVSAAMRVKAFNNQFEADFPEEEDFGTLGGFVAFVLAKIPAKGESFQQGDARVTVLEADPRRVLRLRVEFDRARRREKG